MWSASCWTMFRAVLLCAVPWVGLEKERIGAGLIAGRSSPEALCWRTGQIGCADG